MDCDHEIDIVATYVFGFSSNDDEIDLECVKCGIVFLNGAPGDTLSSIKQSYDHNESSVVLWPD